MLLSMKTKIDDEECVICFKPKEMAKIIPCGHEICKDCLIKIMSSVTMRSICPICRSVINNTMYNDLGEIVNNFRTDSPEFILTDSPVEFIYSYNQPTTPPPHIDWENLEPSETIHSFFKNRNEHLEASRRMTTSLPRLLLINVHHIGHNTSHKVLTKFLFNLMECCDQLRIEDEEFFSSFF